MSFSTLLFQGFCPFHVSCWIYRHKVIHSISLPSFSSCTVCRLVTSLIPDMVIYVFSLFFLISLYRGLLVLLLLKEPAFIDFFLFFCFLFHWFHFDLYYFLSSVYIGIDCSSFASYLTLKLMSLIWDSPQFLYRHFIYKFPPKFWLNNIPQVMICCTFIFIHFKVLSNLPFELFRSPLFSFQIFRDFPHIFVMDFQFNSIVVKEYTLDDLNPFKFIEICCIVSIMVYLGKCSVYP